MKQSFKSLVKKQIRELALLKLSLIKEGHSKMSSLVYNSLEMQEYLKNQEITATQANFLFRFRTRMEKFGENYKAGKPTRPCPVCKETPDTQTHSFECELIQQNVK